MSQAIKSVLQRVERAKEQRAELERKMREWSEEGAYRIATQLDSETGHTLFYVDQLLDVTPTIQALFPEVLHSLRSALDNLAYQLFLRCRSDPAKEGEHVYFPIYDDSKPSKTDPFREIKAFGRPEILKVFHQINPCKSGNLLLWQLHRLDIVDKHRRILTCFSMHHSLYIGAAHKQLLIETGLTDMMPVLELKQAFLTGPKTGRRVQVGDVVFVGFPGDEKVNEHLKFTFDIAFDEPGIIEGKSIVESIDEMIVLVQGIISSFEPFFL